MAAARVPMPQAQSAGSELVAKLDRRRALSEAMSLGGAQAMERRRAIYDYAAGKPDELELRKVRSATYAVGCSMAHA